MKVFVCTADVSGDLHAAALVRCMRERLQAQGESLELVGMGGPELQAQGLEAAVPQADLAVAGLVEVLSSAPRLIAGYRALRLCLTDERPDLVLLVDSPDLNLPLAAVAKRSGLRVFYYVAPQVWAWRYGRVRKLRERVSHVGVIFPFEEELLRNAGIPATFVGHPLVDRIERMKAEFKPDDVAGELGIDRSRPLLGLLPGSRRNEVERNLPIMLEASEICSRMQPELQVVLLLTSSWRSDPPKTLNRVQVIRGRTREAMALCSCLLAAPGTVTVEAGLLGVPMVVTHKVNPLSFEIIRRVSRVPSSCMVNLVAERGVVPEYLQDSARPSILASALGRLLAHPEARAAQIEGLEEMARRLGGGGAPERAADLALRVASGA